MTLSNETLDVLGVGIGPFNLSAAALLSKVDTIKAAFFDRELKRIWHPGVLFNDAEIQVSFLKDLVTLVDPTNPYSFVAYLAAHKRLYRFITAKFNKVLRKEFNDYMHWVSTSLPNLHFNEAINEVHYRQDHFEVITSKRRFESKHLILGSGLTAKVPPFAESLLGREVFHSSTFLNQEHDYNNKRVLIVGGGQSSAEIVSFILKNYIPKAITWTAKSPIFSVMDDSVFANEYFTPHYIDYFFAQPFAKRQQLLKAQTLTSDGISIELLQEIYQLIYQYEFIDKRGNINTFLGNHELSQLIKLDQGFQYTLHQLDNNVLVQRTADMIILCTGYEWQFPDYLQELKSLISFENGYYKINKDYSLNWANHPTNRIYVQNAAKHSHGIADPNLSLMSFRSATIINSIAGKTIYDLDCVEPVMSFKGLKEQQQEKYQHVSAL